MNYEILRVIIDFASISERAMIKVAICSSPGRFKAYHYETEQEDISMKEINKAAAYGAKYSEKEAVALFKNISLIYKYEG